MDIESAFHKNLLSTEIIFSFNKNVFITYKVCHTVPDRGDKAVTKQMKILVPRKLIFYWRTSTMPKLNALYVIAYWSGEEMKIKYRRRVGSLGRGLQF